MFEFLGRYQLTRDIGAEFEYSNLGVGLLGQALALRAGMSYEALVKQRILDPLGMAHTAVTLTPWMHEHLAKGHAPAGWCANWDIPTLAGAGALRSTMNDMLKFARANLDSSERAFTAVDAANACRAPLRGQGHVDRHELVIRSIEQPEIVWHNGGTGGYRTWLGFDKKRRIAAVVLTNSGHGADDLGFELLK